MKLQSQILPHNTVNSQCRAFCGITMVKERRILPLCTQGCWEFMTAFFCPHSSLVPIAQFIHCKPNIASRHSAQSFRMAPLTDT